MFLACFSPAGFPAASLYPGHLPYLADKPVGEDGYYMLTVADNIAARGHIFYNFDLQTTGIQPLATFVFAAIDWCVRRLHGSEWDLVRAVLVSGAVLLVFFAYQLGRIAASLSPQYKQAAFTLAFLLVLTDYTLFRLFTYGLETGVYLCVLALCFQAVQRILAAGKGRAVAADAAFLGITAGLAGLARIDFGLVFAILLLQLLAARRLAPLQALLAGALALAVVSPWFVYLYQVTGSAIPSSGKAESRLITAGDAAARLKVMLLAIGGHIAPWSYGGMSALTSVVTVLSVAALVWLCGAPAGRRARAEAAGAWRVAAFWLPAMLLLACVYTVFFFSTHFYHRYMAPLTVLTIPMLAILLAALPAMRLHLVRTAAVLFCFFAVWTAGALHRGTVGNTQTIAAGYIRAHYPLARVGAFQSGAVGYFNRNVENLDGKLNLAAWTAAQHHALPAFIDREGIDVLVDWPSVIHFFLPADYLAREWQPCPIPLTGTESVCLVRKGSAAAAAARER